MDITWVERLVHGKWDPHGHPSTRNGREDKGTSMERGMKRIVIEAWGTNRALSGKVSGNKLSL